MERPGNEQSRREELAERADEAKSKDPLKDVSDQDKTAPPKDEPHGNPPSPDGALDEKREIKDYDPT